MEQSQLQVPKRPGAYAVSTESKGEPTLFALPVPPGTKPGSTFSFRAGERSGLSVRCPTTAKAGDVLQVALSPEPETHYTSLKPSPLTTLSETPHGGAKPMSAATKQANQEFLEETADVFVVTIPAGIFEGDKFIAQTPMGERYVVTCPLGSRAGQKLRIPTPPPPPRGGGGGGGGGAGNNHDNDDNGDGDDNAMTKTFQFKAPPNVRPRQVIRVLVCGKKIPIKLPANVVPGQILHLKLPVEQVVENIEISYEDKSSTSKGWRRTVRLTDLKFQWIYNQQTEDDSTGQNLKQQNSLGQAAFCRKITSLEGNDPRMRTGKLELVPASQVCSESTLWHHGKTLLSYATIADIQTKSWEEKLNWFQGVCAELTAPWESGRIRLLIRREHLLTDSVKAVMSLSRADMRKRWRIEMLNEPAIDSGGVMREWFQLVSNQLFDPDFGLWLPSINNQKCMHINPASDISCPEDHLIYFRFLGRLMGRALFDCQLIDGHMVRYLHKHLLGWPITFDDLKASDEVFYQSMWQFTKMQPDEISSLCLDFTLAEDSMGIHRNVELIEGGTSVEVTADNLPQYLEAILKYRMLHRTKDQIAELLMGFYDVAPEPALTVFDPNELELMLCGLPTIDIDDWEKNTIYSGGLVSDHYVVRWFWEVVRDDLDKEMRARLLQFVTGTSGVPSRGFSVLQGNDGNIKKFAIHGVSRQTYAYPRAHTCFNRIDLPDYDTKEELLEKLKAAVTLSSVGFDIE